MRAIPDSFGRSASGRAVFIFIATIMDSNVELSTVIGLESYELQNAAADEVLLEGKFPLRDSFRTLAWSDARGRRRHL